MAYLLTTATDGNDLLDKLGTFAAAHGWTVAYKSIGTTSQLGLNKGNCFVALGTRADITRQMLNAGGTVTDKPIVGTLASALDGGASYYGGHTGAPGGTSQTSTNHVWTNDWKGPFSEVHFISGPNNDYIHVIAKTVWLTPRIETRYSFLSFGLLDMVGATVPAVPYLTGTWFEFWENNASPTNSNYKPNRADATGSYPSAAAGTSSSASTGHVYAFNMANIDGNVAENVHYRLPSGVIDTALFSSVPAVARAQPISRKVFNKNSDVRVTTGFNAMDDLANFAAPLISSIGLPMIPINCLYGAGYTSTICHLGQFPGVRAVNMTNLEPDEEFVVNLDTWITFPIKCKGTEANSAVFAGANTWINGYAFLKE